MHNMCSMASPQDVERTSIDRFKPYISDIVNTFREDKRVVWWEIFNEPNQKDTFSIGLRHAGFGWAKAQNPTQPVIACWDDHDDTEIVDHHQYFLPWGENNDVFSNPAKGGIVTEAGARWYQHTKGDSGSPLTVLNWLTALKKSGQAPFIPGVMIDWALMIGHDQTRWHWGDAEGLAEPPIPWHGHLYPDGTPVSFTEAAATRRYTTGVDEFLFVETFLDVASPAAVEKFLTLQPGESFDSKGLNAKEGLFELTFWPETPLTSASGCVGEQKDFMGADVQHTFFTGSTDEEKDASCCALCEANSQCEFWVRAADPADNDCWLKKDFTSSFPRDIRRGNFNSKACAFIGEAKTFHGTLVLETFYSGSTEEEKDESCCSKCRANPDCEFWVRSTTSTQCALRKGFTGFMTSTSRGNFKHKVWNSKLSFKVAGTYTITIDAFDLKLSDSEKELASVPVLAGIPEGGVVMDSWNMLRVLVRQDRVQVWFNPQFSDVTGGSVPPQDEQSMQAMPPRIDVPVTTVAAGGDLTILAPPANKGNIRVDYVSALPPKLYGLAADSAALPAVSV